MEITEERRVEPWASAFSLQDVGIILNVQNHIQKILSEVGLWPLSSFPLCKAWWSEMFSLSTSSGKATTKLSLPAHSNARYVSFCLVVLLFLTMIKNNLNSNVWSWFVLKCAGDLVLVCCTGFIFKVSALMKNRVLIRPVPLKSPWLYGLWDWWLDPCAHGMD